MGQELTRREVLKRGATVGIGLAWATPVVQGVSMMRSAAAATSGDPNDGQVLWSDRFKGSDGDPLRSEYAQYWNIRDIPFVISGGAAEKPRSESAFRHAVLPHISVQSGPVDLKHTFLYQSQIWRGWYSTAYHSQTSDPASCYFSAVVNASAGGYQANQIQIGEVVGGFVSTLFAAAVPASGLVDNTSYSMRWRIDGQQMWSRLWKSGDVEPDYWDLETMGDGRRSTGPYGFAHDTTSNRPTKTYGFQISKVPTA